MRRDVAELKEKGRRRETVQSGGCYPGWEEEEERKQEGDIPCSGKVGQKCVSGETQGVENFMSI